MKRIFLFFALLLNVYALNAQTFTFNMYDETNSKYRIDIDVSSKYITATKGNSTLFSCSYYNHTINTSQQRIGLSLQSGTNPVTSPEGSSYFIISRGKGISIRLTNGNNYNVKCDNASVNASTYDQLAKELRPKFAYFNMNEVAQAMPEFTAAQKEFDAKQKNYQDELQRMRDEFNVKQENYHKNAASLPDAVKYRREQELIELQQRIQEYEVKSKNDLADLKDQNLKEIRDKILKTVEEIGKAGGYVCVYDIANPPSSINTISVDINYVDITKDVKTKLGIR